MTDSIPLSTGAAERKTAQVLSRCVYRIATGKWTEGERLPSVREAGAAWGVDRRTVLAAYRELERRGLVRRVPRSGFFVAPGPALGRVSRHRHELERLYEQFEREIVSRPGLSALGAFRYLAQLATIREAEHPTCAFVECTAAQARGHAREVQERLGIPCLALTLDELSDRRERVPLHVRTLLVSTFHYGELGALREARDLEVHSIPLEVSPLLVEELPRGVRHATLLESDEGEAHDIVEDVRALGPDFELDSRVTDDVEAALAELFPDRAARRGRVALLSPRLWGGLPAELRQDPALREVTFRVRESAWPAAADALGMPLGELA